MAEEEELQNPEGVQEEEIAQGQETQKKEIRSFYFYDHNQGNEYSENIIAVLLPSSETIFIKRRIKGDQVLIPLKQFKNRFLKIWKDGKGNLLYNVSTIAEPLFTHLYKAKDIEGGTKSIGINDDSITIVIVDNFDNKKYEIQINEEFFKQIDSCMKDMLALALYHLYVAPLI